MEHTNKLIVNKKHSMKNYLNIIFVICLISSTLACKSQQLIQKPSDIINLKQDNSRFIGKPLKDLLKEIRPAIRTVSATSTNNQHLKNGYIIFRFVNRTENDAIRNKVKYHMLLRFILRSRLNGTREKISGQKITNLPGQKMIFQNMEISL